MVDLRLRRLEVERQLIVRAGRTEGLGARQFPGQRRGGEKGGAIWDGGGGGRRRHNVVIGVDRRQAGRDGKVRLLLLRLRLFLLAAIILVREGGRILGYRTDKDRKLKSNKEIRERPRSWL